MNTMLGFLPNLGMGELMILAFLGLLIFGKKLPEVGKSLGQGIVSFKKGLQGMEAQVNNAVNAPEPVKKKKKKKKAAIVHQASPMSSAEESIETGDAAATANTGPETVPSTRTE